MIRASLRAGVLAAVAVGVVAWLPTQALAEGNPPPVNHLTEYMIDEPNIPMVWSGLTAVVDAR